MSYLSKIVNVALLIMFLTPIIMAIFTFFGVPFATYANYVLWMIALGIFYVIIPFTKVDIFK